MKKKKAKEDKVDGLSRKDVMKISGAIRQVWQRSHPRRLCVKRATLEDGFVTCEKCQQVVPKVFIDHKIPVGPVDAKDGGFIARLFCPSTELQALCKECHRVKTREDRLAANG